METSYLLAYKRQDQAIFLSSKGNLLLAFSLIFRSLR